MLPYRKPSGSTRPGLLSRSSSGNPGFGVIEIIIASAIIGIVVFSLIQVGQFSLKLSRLASDRVAAGFLLQEAMEGMKLLRDESWSANIANLTTGTPYFLTFNGSRYTLTGAEPPLIDRKFRRRIVLSEVRRNAQQDIAASGTVDPSTKKVTLELSWLNGTATTTDSIEFYIADLFQN